MMKELAGLEALGQAAISVDDTKPTDVQDPLELGITDLSQDAPALRNKAIKPLDLQSAGEERGYLLPAG
jgi:hypothetical protein